MPATIPERYSIDSRDLVSIALAAAIIAPIALAGHLLLSARIGRHGVTLAWEDVGGALAWTALGLCAGTLYNLCSALEPDAAPALTPDAMHEPEIETEAEAEASEPPLALKRKEVH